METIADDIVVWVVSRTYKGITEVNCYDTYNAAYINAYEAMWKHAKWNWSHIQLYHYEDPPPQHLQALYIDTKKFYDTIKDGVLINDNSFEMGLSALHTKCCAMLFENQGALLCNVHKCIMNSSTQIV
jgi:hypothetical protein